MIRPTAFRVLPAVPVPVPVPVPVAVAVAVTVAPALPLAQGAQAAAPAPVASVTAAVGRPGQVRLADTDFMCSHPRVEVRYGGSGPRTRPASWPRRRR